MSRHSSQGRTTTSFFKLLALPKQNYLFPYGKFLSTAVLLSFIEVAHTMSQLYFRLCMRDKQKRGITSLLGLLGDWSLFTFLVVNNHRNVRVGLSATARLLNVMLSKNFMMTHRTCVPALEGVVDMEVFP